MTTASPASTDLIYAIVARHKSEPGAMLPILHAIQEAVGYVPADAVQVIANELNLSRAEVHGVVTFYHDFRHEPAGRHVLKMCRAEACQSMGCESLVARAEETLGTPCGSTTADGNVTLEAIYCLGLCATGPSALLDGKPIGRLTEARLDTLLKGVTA